MQKLTVVVFLVVGMAVTAGYTQEMSEGVKKFQGNYTKNPDVESGYSVASGGFIPPVSHENPETVGVNENMEPQEEVKSGTIGFFIQNDASYQTFFEKGDE